MLSMTLPGFPSWSCRIAPKQESPGRKTAAHTAERTGKESICTRLPPCRRPHAVTGLTSNAFRASELA